MKKRMITMVILCIFIATVFPTKTVTAGETSEGKIEKNLLECSYGSQGLSGWANSQAWQSYEWGFWPKANTSAMMYQDVLIEDMSVGTEMRLSAKMQSFDQSPPDIGTLELQFLNEDKSKVLLSKNVSNTIVSVWTPYSITLKVPEGAKYARIKLYGTRRCGTDLNSYFNEILFGKVVKDKILKVVLEVNEELQLSVNDDLLVNTKMTWTSTDTMVATVDANGVVKALKPGDTKVKVTNRDGSYTDYINILVVENAVDLRLAVDLKVGILVC